MAPAGGWWVVNLKARRDTRLHSNEVNSKVTNRKFGFCLLLSSTVIGCLL